MPIKKRIFAREELQNFADDPTSAVELVHNVTVDVLLHPQYLGDRILDGIWVGLFANYKRYYSPLGGIILGYENIKVDPDSGVFYGRHAELKYAVHCSCYLFKPKVGSKLSGVVNVISPDHIGCLVHKYFNVTIKRPENEDYETWNNRPIDFHDKITFTIVELDYTSDIPYIEGQLGELPFRKPAVPEQPQPRDDEQKEFIRLLGSIKSEKPEDQGNSTKKKKSKRKEPEANDTESQDNGEVGKQIKAKKRKRLNENNSESDSSVFKTPPLKKHKTAEATLLSFGFTSAVKSPLRNGLSTESPAPSTSASPAKKKKSVKALMMNEHVGSPLRNGLSTESMSPAPSTSASPVKNKKAAKALMMDELDGSIESTPASSLSASPSKKKKAKERLVSLEPNVTSTTSNAKPEKKRPAKTFPDPDTASKHYLEAIEAVVGTVDETCASVQDTDSSILQKKPKKGKPNDILVVNIVTEDSVELSSSPSKKPKTVKPPAASVFSNVNSNVSSSSIFPKSPKKAKPTANLGADSNLKTIPKSAVEATSSPPKKKNTKPEGTNSNLNSEVAKTSPATVSRHYAESIEAVVELGSEETAKAIEQPSTSSPPKKAKKKAPKPVTSSEASPKKLVKTSVSNPSPKKKELPTTSPKKVLDADTLALHYMEAIEAAVELGSEGMSDFYEQPSSSSPPKKAIKSSTLEVQPSEVNLPGGPTKKPKKKKPVSSLDASLSSKNQVLPTSPKKVPDTASQHYLEAIEAAVERGSDGLDDSSAITTNSSPPKTPKKKATKPTEAGTSTSHVSEDKKKPEVKRKKRSSVSYTQFLQFLEGQGPKGSEMQAQFEAFVQGQTAEKKTKAKGILKATNVGKQSHA